MHVINHLIHLDSPKWSYNNPKLHIGSIYYISLHYILGLEFHAFLYARYSIIVSQLQNGVRQKFET
jgi:hypothetical protein